MLSFILAVFILTVLYKKRNDRSGKYSLVKIWKAIILSSFGIFLLLPSLIWKVNTFNDFHITFVYLYTTLCQLLAYTGNLYKTKIGNVICSFLFISVACRCSKLWSNCVILCAYTCKISCERLLSTFV